MKIPDALRDSLVTLVLVSDAYRRAFYHRAEAQLAIALSRRPDAAHRVIPILLDGTPADPALLPYGLALKVPIDARGRAIESVADELEALASDQRSDASLSGVPGPSPRSVPTPPPTPAPVAAPAEAPVLREALEVMMDTLFNQLVRSEFPDSLPHLRPTPRVARVDDLLDWCRDHGQRPQLLAAARRLAPGLFP